MVSVSAKIMTIKMDCPSRTLNQSMKVMREREREREREGRWKTGARTMEK